MLHKNVLKKTKHPFLFPKGLQIRYFIETENKNSTNFFSFFRINYFKAQKTLTTLYNSLFADFICFFIPFIQEPTNLVHRNHLTAIFK